MSENTVFKMILKNKTLTMLTFHLKKKVYLSKSLLNIVNIVFSDEYAQGWAKYYQIKI